MEKIKIFSAYYKQYYIPKSPIFCPIHVGHINSQNELGLLADDTGDEEYLAILFETLPKLIAQVKPDIMLFQSAVDVLATDKLGKLALTREGCQQRDEFVFSQAKANGIPIAVSMGGGYSEDVNEVVEAHCNTFRLAKKLFG